MPITLISQFPAEKRKAPLGEYFLNIAEMFCDTLQGEGVYAGVPATFMRLQGCTLACTWCDTLEVWKQGNPYSFKEIFALFESVGLIDRFKKGQHLILTGGSPLMQQETLAVFLKEFEKKYTFLPFIQIENEVTLRPTSLIPFIDCWNNSPKLANSGMKERIRYKADLIHQMSVLDQSWFKFVINDDMDWKEIESHYLEPGLISRHQIILMPCGQTQEELAQTREFVADLAIRENVRFSDRLHVTIWNKKTGV
jgi:7-carboxy-7-deazaguanine synthase